MAEKALAMVIENASVQGFSMGRADVLLIGKSYTPSSEQTPFAHGESSLHKMGTQPFA